MDRRPLLFAAAVPWSLSAAVGLLRGLQSAGADRPWIARFAGSVALLEIGTGILLGAALAALLSVLGRAEERLAGSIATGYAAALAALLLSAETPAGRGWAFAIAVLAGIGGALWRSVFRGDRTPLAACFGAPAGLLAGATASRFVIAALHLSPASSGGMAATIVLAILGAALGLAAERRLPSSVAVLAVALPTLAAAACVAAGRPIDPALRSRGPGAADVLVVVLDTARADAVPAPERAAFPTPTLRRLAREGTRFTRVFSTSCWTLPAHASLFTGLPAVEHGTGWERTALDTPAPTLAERFRDAGYRTAGFSANPWITRELRFDRGFETFVEADASRAPRRPWMLRFFPEWFAGSEGALFYEDKRGMRLTNELLRSLSRDDGRPVFAFLNLLEPHLPYDPPDRYLAGVERTGFSRAELEGIDQERLDDLRPDLRRGPRDFEGLRILYEAEVAYADHLLGRVVAALEDAGRLDRTEILIVSDHGENLGAHAPLDHQLGLWDTLLHVPAIVRAPGRFAAGAVDERLLSLADAGALVLPDAATPEGREHVVGSYDRPGPVLDQIRGRLGLDPTPWDRRLHAWRTLDRKWILASDGASAAFDLRSDPGEHRDLATSGRPPAEFAPLEEGLASFLAERARPLEPGEAPAIDEETLRRLRSLGYVP